MSYQTSLSRNGITLFILFLFLTLISLVGHPVSASVILQDDFEDGDVNTSIYTPLGGAVLEEVGGKLLVRVFSWPGDGVRINIPTGSHPRCLRIRQDIDPSQFPVGQVWQHSLLMANDAGETTGFVLSAERAFWNRCTYKLTNQRTGAVVHSAFLAPPAETPDVKFECPGPKDVRIDWLPPTEPGGKDRLQIEVTGAQAGIVGKFKLLTIKPTEIRHDGGGPGPFRLTAWKIETGDPKQVT